MNEDGSRPPRWLERPGSVLAIIRALALVCSLVVLADFFYEKHGHYSWENFPGFYAIFGFVSCVVLVLVATRLRKILKRDEDYYD
ncbi:MAG TPA: hypothetical protein EYG54_09970 [Myxococcales bacterium]|nr:hypothetical protein [Myxococcales bacterium]